MACDCGRMANYGTAVLEAPDRSRSWSAMRPQSQAYGCNRGRCRS